MELLNVITTALSFLTFVIVAYDKVRGSFLKATLNGQPFNVPKDEVKEAYRRAALAETSRLAGGRQRKLDVHYEGYLLVIETKDDIEVKK